MEIIDDAVIGKMYRPFKNQTISAWKVRFDGFRINWNICKLNIILCDHCFFKWYNSKYNSIYKGIAKELKLERRETISAFEEKFTGEQKILLVD